MRKKNTEVTWEKKQKETPHCQQHSLRASGWSTGRPRRPVCVKRFRVKITCYAWPLFQALTATQKNLLFLTPGTLPGSLIMSHILSWPFPSSDISPVLVVTFRPPRQVRQIQALSIQLFYTSGRLSSSFQADIDTTESFNNWLVLQPETAITNWLFIHSFSIHCVSSFWWQLKPRFTKDK